MTNLASPVNEFIGCSGVVVARTDTKPEIELRRTVTVFDELYELPRQLNERAHHLFPNRTDVSGATA